MQGTPFFLIFLAATAEPTSLPQFAGYWFTNNPQSEIEALKISLDGSRMIVRAWARRGESISEWGSADAVAATPLNSLRTAQSVSATFQMPDRRVVLILQFEDLSAQVLRVTVMTHFTDGSGSPDVSEKDTLRRVRRARQVRRAQFLALRARAGAHARPVLPRPSEVRSHRVPLRLLRVRVRPAPPRLLRVRSRHKGSLDWDS
jgi:hypothetical protein